MHSNSKTHTIYLVMVGIRGGVFVSESVAEVTVVRGVCIWVSVTSRIGVCSTVGIWTGVTGVSVSPGNNWGYVSSRCNGQDAGESKNNLEKNMITTKNIQKCLLNFVQDVQFYTQIFKVNLYYILLIVNK